METPAERDGAALIWCPFPDVASAEQAAATLLDDRLIACANLLPSMISLYSWRGERGRADEVAALFKTTAATLDAAIARLGRIHPYDAPAITAWHCDAAGAATLAWLAAEVGTP